jgi:hypothetical protein
LRAFRLVEGVSSTAGDSAAAGDEGQAADFPGRPRFPLPLGPEADRGDDETEVWGTVTLTKRLWDDQVASQESARAGQIDADDELKYEEEGGELDNGGLPEGPDDEMDGDDLYEGDQEQDGEYAYDDDQQPDGEVAGLPPWDDAVEFPFDPRVDDRYFQHSSDDEVEPDAPGSDEFDLGSEDEPLRL